MTARWCCLPAPLPGGSLGFLLACGGLPRTSATQGRSGSCWIRKAGPAALLPYSWSCSLESREQRPSKTHGQRGSVDVTR